MSLFSERSKCFQKKKNIHVYANAINLVIRLQRVYLDTV